MTAQPTLYGPAHPFAGDFLYNEPLMPTMPFTEAEVDAWFNMPTQVPTQVPTCLYHTQYVLTRLCTQQYPSGGFWNQ